MRDLDHAFAALAEAPGPALATPEQVRRRGEQRRRRTRAGVAAAGALAVLAGGGVAVGFAAHPAKPDSLQVVDNPTPAATSDPITWAAFPSVTRMNELFPGDWVSGQVQVSDGTPQDDRCTPDVVLAQVPRAFVSRRLRTTDSEQQVAFLVQDFATTDEAKAVLSHQREQLARCPTVATDGPAAGSQETGTVVESGPDAFTTRRTEQVCLRPHAGCTDTTSLQRWMVSGHLLLTVSGYRTTEPTFSLSEMDAFTNAFAQQATTTYGREPNLLSRPTPQEATTGTTYYGAFLWAGNAGQTDGESQEQQRAASWGHVLVAPLDCLEGGAAAVGRDHPGASHGDAVVLLFTSASEAEAFVNVYDGHVEGVGSVTVRCLA